MAQSKETYRTWVEINTTALKHNMQTLTKRLPKNVLSVAVVKGNAYGHGLYVTALYALLGGADYLAVFDIHEAVELRKGRMSCPILVLKNIYPEEVSLATKYDLDIAVSTFELLYALKKAKLAKSISIHLIADTGLGRDGFLAFEMNQVISHVSHNTNIEVKGLMTHFSGSESRKFDAYTSSQVRELLLWKKELSKVRIKPMLHASATAGTFLSKKYGMDMVRFGIGLYGMWPSDETKEIDRNKTILEPVLSWRARISEVKRLPKGSFVAYDCSVQLRRDSVVAIIPVGYYDGYPRSASGKSFVLIAGKRAKVLGRVMMNMMVVDITGIESVSQGDMATLIGSDGDERISAEELAKAAATINYEITTRINESIPRIAQF